MPGPAIAAIAGGLGSALIGARASGKAADAQSKASDQQIQLQADMFNRMDDLQAHLYRNQSRDVYKARDAQLGSSNQARRQALNAARGLRNRGDALQTATYRRNQNALRDAGQQGMRDFNGNLRQNLGDANRTFGRGMDTARDVRDASINTSRDLMRRNIGDLRGEMETGTDRLNRTQTQNIGTLNAAQDASLAAFQPALGLGNNALRAYASNLGIGKAPRGYAGMELTPAAKFNMEQGREITEGGAAGAGGLYSGATMAALEKLRGGIAAQDRGNQMAELMGLGQVGQNAANSMADIRGLYSGRVTDQRDRATQGVNALRGAYTGQITGQRDQFGNRFNAAQDAFGDRSLTLGQNRLNAASQARNFATMGRNDLRQWQTGNQMNVNNAYNQGSYGVASDFANAFTNATDTQAGRNIGIQGDWLSNLGAARGNRANLYGTAAMNYANGASNALANRGDARAQGAIGGANSMLGGIQNGLGIYGMLGGQFGQPQVGQGMFGGQGFGNWLRGMF